MRKDQVESWLQGYFKAWRTAGVALLPQLFTDDIAYIPSPWRPALTGLDKVKVFWENARTGADEEFDAATEIVALDNRVAIVRVEVKYANDEPSKWRDLWVIHFDADEKCRKFEEWPFTSDQHDGHEYESSE